MKKTLVACLAVVALVAFATGAGAITCTVDTHPAATLLIPYFQATFNADGTVLGTGASAFDTLVTIGNASSAPMLAHVSVWSERSELVLDFNIALTGFDIQSFSMASVLRGGLPQTGFGSPLEDGCQRNPLATVFPDTTGGGFLRVRPGAPATGSDNTLATTLYPNGPFNSAFLFNVLDSLDATPDSVACTGTVDQVITNPIHGYITIDHANYCNLSNPSVPLYWTNDAAGMENNLWGDYIYTSAAGIGTEGFSAVAIEADASLEDETGAPTDNLWGTDCGPGTADCQGRRTFYRRYVTTADTNFCNPGNAFGSNTFDCGFGDQREPLGLKYASRWLDDSLAGVTSFFEVWRASAIPSANGGLQDLLGSSCTTVEPTVNMTFFDEDENTVSQGVCPSPCSNPSFNFPLETQRTQITAFSHPTSGAGWVSMSFYNGSGPVNGNLDQAWVTYDFQGPAAFIAAGIPAAQLDPSSCEPLQVVPDPAGVSFPEVTTLFGSGP